MTDNNRNASDRGLRYRAPQAKVIEVKAQVVLCLSPGVNGYDEGSSSEGGDMTERGNGW